MDGTTTTIFLITCNGGNCAIQSNDASTLDRLKTLVVGKFQALQFNSIQMLYSAGSFENCCLTTQMDFDTMLIVSAMFKPSIVKIVIQTPEDSSTPVLNKEFNPVTPLRTRKKPPTKVNSEINGSQVPTDESHCVGSENFHFDSGSMATRIRKQVNRVGLGSTVDLECSSSKTNQTSHHDEDLAASGDWSDYEDFLPNGDGYQDNVGQEEDSFGQEEDNGGDYYDRAVSQQEVKEKRFADRKARRAVRDKCNLCGNWFDGVQETILDYDISMPPVDVTLQTDGWANNITGLGQRFPSGVTQFRRELIKYASKLGFHFQYVRNDLRFVHAVCKYKEEEGCLWHVYENFHKITQAVVIRKANLVHTCKLAVLRNDTTRLSAQLVAEMVQEKMRATPNAKPKQIQTDLLGSHGLALTYMKVWRGVEVAKANIFGSYHDSFNELQWYSDAILSTNPGSVVALDVEQSTNPFKRFSFSFKASIDGFKHCRPMLFIDGTFMNNRYKGTLLVATAKDGNNGMIIELVILELMSSKTCD